MRTLQDEVTDRGFQIVAIKTGLHQDRGCNTGNHQVLFRIRR